MSRAIVAAAGGVATGLASTGRVLSGGVGYGVFLTLTFLYSRFGGSAHDLPAYTVFVLAMSVGGAIAGVVTVYVGSRLLTRD